MKESKFTVLSPVDALPLSCLMLEPEGEVRALVLMAHGIATHKERLMSIMRVFAENGFAVIINDQRGYGESMRSAEDFGFTYGAGADGMMKDMRAVGEYIANRYPSKKLFLCGHSMGALEVMCYLKRWGRDVNGAILAGLPAWNPAVGVGKAYLKGKKLFKGARFKDDAVFKLMENFYASKFKDSASPYSWLNSDPNGVKEYEDDPLCGKLGTVEGYIAMTDLMSEAYDKTGWNNVSELTPVLISVGGDDPCADGEKGAGDGCAFLKGRGLVRTDYMCYPGMRHEIHNEPEGNRVAADMLNRLLAWL